MQPIRISRQLQLAYPSVPDTRAVVEGIEMELIWHGCKTVSRTDREYAFTTPGVSLGATGGGAVSWLVREGRVRVVSLNELHVDLAFDPVLLFAVPAVLAGVLAVLPISPWTKQPFENYDLRRANQLFSASPALLRASA